MILKTLSDTARPKSVGDKLSAAEVNRDLPIVVTAGEVIASTPVAVYIKDADGYIYKTTATPFAENVENFIGFAMDVAGASGSAVAVQTHGIVGGFSGLDAGKLYYLSDTAGIISTAVGTIRVLVGVAISTTQILVLHRRPKLGGWASKSIDTIYQASTDGLVVVMIVQNDATGMVDGFTDGSNPPTTQRCSVYVATGDAGCGSFTMPVKKGDYWEVNDDVNAINVSSLTIYWIPLY